MFSGALCISRCSSKNKARLSKMPIKFSVWHWATIATFVADIPRTVDVRIDWWMDGRVPARPRRRRRKSSSSSRRRGNHKSNNGNKLRWLLWPASCLHLLPLPPPRHASQANSHVPVTTEGIRILFLKFSYRNSAEPPLFTQFFKGRRVFLLFEQLNMCTAGFKRRGTS